MEPVGFDRRHARERGKPDAGSADALFRILTATRAERWTISVRRVEEAWPERQAHSAEPIDTVLLAERPGYAGARSWGVWGAISWPPIPLAAIDGADHRPQRGGHDVGVEADAPADLAAVHARLDVSGRAGVRPFAEGVLGVIGQLHLDAGLAQGIDEGGDGTVAVALEPALAAGHPDLGLDGRLAALGRGRDDRVADQRDGRRRRQVGRLEGRPDLIGRDLGAARLRELLDDGRELDLQ